MATAAALAVKITANITDFTSNLDKAEKALVRAADKLEATGKRLTLGVTVPFLGLSAALAKSAAEDAASVAKLQRTFGGAAGAMEQWIQQLMKTVPATDDEIRGLASSTDTLLRSMGLAPSRAVQMTQAVTQLAGDLAAYNHVELGVAQDALEKALAGKTRSLQEFGIIVSEADIKAEAYRLGIAKVGQELTHAQTAQAAWAAILEHSKIQQGEAARTINDDANALARLRQAADNAADSFGAVVLPTVAAVTDGVAGLLQKLANLPPAAKVVVTSMGAVVAAAGPAIWAVGEMAGRVTKLNAALKALSGTTALAGLARVMTGFTAIAGLVGIPILAVAHAFDKEGESARRAAENLDTYRTALTRLSEAQLKAAGGDLSRVMATLQAQRTRLLGSLKPLPTPSSGEYDVNVGARIIAANQRVQTQINALDQQISAVRGMQDAVGTALAGPASGGAPGGGTGAGGALDALEARLKAVTEGIDAFTKTGMKVPGLGDQIASAWSLVNAAVTKAGSAMDQTSMKVRELSANLSEAINKLSKAQSEAARSTMVIPASAIPQTTALGAQVDRRVLVQTAIAGMPAYTGAGTPTMAVTPNLPALDVKIPGKLDAVRTAVMDGFAQLPLALGQQLMAVLGARNGPGGQIGAALGGTFGGSAIASLAKGWITKNAGSVLGAGIGSAIPVFGTIAGSLLGGALGGLFGKHKKKVDESAEALNKLAETTKAVNEAFTNLPQGLKVAQYRFDASEPTAPPPPPTQPPPGTPPDGLKPGEGSPSGTGGTGSTGNPVGTGGDTIKPAILITGPVYLQGVQDVSTLWRKLGEHAEQVGARGGTTPLTLAFGAA